MILMRDGSLSPGTERAHTAAIVLHCPGCPLEVAHAVSTQIHTKRSGGDGGWLWFSIKEEPSKIDDLGLNLLDSIGLAGGGAGGGGGGVFEFSLPLQEARRGDLSEIGRVRQG